MPHSAYLGAVQLFNASRYFEAHEVWEEVWKVAEEPERSFLQGLIQAAVAMYHFQNRNVEGAISLASRALRRLDFYPASYAGIQVGAFRTQLAAWLNALEGGSRPTMLRIRLLTEDHSSDADL